MTDITTNTARQISYGIMIFDYQQVFTCPVKSHTIFYLLPEM